MKQTLFDLFSCAGGAFRIRSTYITFEIRASHNVDIIFRRANIDSSNINLARGERCASRRNDINIPVIALLSGATKTFPRAPQNFIALGRFVRKTRILAESSYDGRAPRTRVCRHYRLSA